MYCPNCGNPLHDTERFCPRCGQMLPQSTMRGGGNAGGQKKSSVLPILLGVLVSVALMVALFFVLRPVLLGGQRAALNAQSPQPTETSAAAAQEAQATSAPTSEATEPAAAETPIKIGSILPISGDISYYGVSVRNGINLAADEYNKKGGINGRQIEVVFADDEANPEKTVMAFDKMISDDKIDALIGALTSKCSLAIAKQAQQNKIVMITPSSTNEAVTQVGDCIFRACYSDLFQGQSVAKFAYENLRATKAAVLYDVTNDYSKGLSDRFIKYFKERGGSVVAREAYATGDTDFTQQILKIKKANPDVIFLPDYYNTVALIAKQINLSGIKVPLLGADGWDMITDYVGDEIVGGYYSNHFSADADVTTVKNFVQNYSENFGETPNALAALGYDAACILFDAMERAGGTDSEKVKAALMETNKRYVTGQISFDENRNPIKSLFMLKIVSGGSGYQAVFDSVVDP